MKIHRLGLVQLDKGKQRRWQQAITTTKQIKCIIDNNMQINHSMCSQMRNQQDTTNHWRMQGHTMKPCESQLVWDNSESEAPANDIDNKNKGYKTMRFDIGHTMNPTKMKPNKLQTFIQLDIKQRKKKAAIGTTEGKQSTSVPFRVMMTQISTTQKNYFHLIIWHKILKLGLTHLWKSNINTNKWWHEWWSKTGEATRGNSPLFCLKFWYMWLLCSIEIPYEWRF